MTRKGECFTFSRRQASDFAKQVADDFNPIHNEDAKRFCVPGDLLFSFLLSRVGLHQKMQCTFSGMVGGDLALRLDEAENEVRILDEAGKEYLDVRFEGERSQDMALIEHLVRRYVRFSGQNFPHILGPLMEKHQVMVNPARPLVMYQSMAVSLERLDLKAPEVVLSGAELEVVGKRGNVTLYFNFVEDDLVVGTGEKQMVLSGLVPFDQAGMDGMVALYHSLKAQYQG
ncbi:DUF3581 family protein [Gallaecimonas sp. GXIMD4217]|uniref:DUF3581 family protein n=1 Tax=Gallaecimonas sp. GXIMD4217 TaxID=3131927 RepID=UPI00311AC89C